MTLEEFERTVFQIASSSPLCEIPAVRNLTPTSVTIRVPMTNDGFVDAFFNEETGTTAFALVQENRRIFGADNTGGWHLHPFEEPDEHWPRSKGMSFAEFIAAIEKHGIGGM
ncbi:MAG: hypothetical protein HY782_21360 [Chloroflexi bacterium]|nr:hypothetical protein [Chloroflexota bacterium]